jgi:hypothetical protein
MNPSNLERLISTAAQLGATLALQQAGHISGEISEREAFRVYGSWLRHAVEQGRIQPHRSGVGTNSKKLYNVGQILALRASDEARAELKIQ